MSDELFRDPLTFLELPRSTDFGGADVAIMGVPFDCGRDATRFGARMGPNAVRHASILTRVLLKDAEPFPLDQIRVIDAGNVDLPADDILRAFAQIEAAMTEVLSHGCIPLTVGGDGAVSLPQMRALQEAHGPIAVVHFDAHTDTWPLPDDGRHNNANQFTFAGNESLIDRAAAMHIGIRGPVNAAANIAFAESMGYRVIPFEQYRELGSAAVLADVRETVGTKPLFVCFDLDFFDPAFAPGVATPTPGGATPEEGLQLMRGLAGLDIIGIDINTMAPLHDAGNATAILAASLLAESLGVLGSNHASR
jgi:agmatinase